VHVDALAPVVVIVQHVDGSSGLRFPEVKSRSRVNMWMRRSWMVDPRLSITAGNGPSEGEGGHDLKDMHGVGEYCFCSLGLV